MNINIVRFTSKSSFKASVFVGRKGIFLRPRYFRLILSVWHWLAMRATHFMRVVSCRSRPINILLLRSFWLKFHAYFPSDRGLPTDQLQSACDVLSMSVFCVVTPCGLAGGYQRFGGTSSFMAYSLYRALASSIASRIVYHWPLFSISEEHTASTFLRNVGIYLQVHPVLLSSLPWQPQISCWWNVKGFRERHRKFYLLE
jgi:hypothetical protein